MRGQAFIKLIDEADTAYIDLGEYGVSLIRGWREALLTPAGVKDYIENNNRLEHGVQALTSKKYCKKAKRSVSLNMLLEGETEEDYLLKYESFLDKIAYSGEICLKVPVLKRVFKIVYSACKQYGDFGLRKGNFTLTFEEDNPDNREVIE